MTELSVAIGIIIALLRLAVTLQAVVHLMQDLVHLAMANWMPYAAQGLSQLTCAL
jgi:hypothetical protein